MTILTILYPTIFLLFIAKPIENLSPFILLILFLTIHFSPDFDHPKTGYSLLVTDISS